MPVRARPRRAGRAAAPARRPSARVRRRRRRRSRGPSGGRRCRAPRSSSAASGFAGEVSLERCDLPSVERAGARRAPAAGRGARRRVGPEERFSSSDHARSVAANAASGDEKPGDEGAVERQVCEVSAWNGGVPGWRHRRPGGAPPLFGCPTVLPAGIRLIFESKPESVPRRTGSWSRNGLSFWSTPSPSVERSLPLMQRSGHDPQLDVDHVVGQTTAVRVAGGVARRARRGGSGCRRRIVPRLSLIVSTGLPVCWFRPGRP